MRGYVFLFLLDDSCNSFLLQVHQTVHPAGANLERLVLNQLLVVLRKNKNKNKKTK
jgi:hypothetical protein